MCRFLSRAAAFLVCLLTAGVGAAAAQQPAPAMCAGPGECLCDNSYQDCRTPILELIRNERVGIDVSFWFMSDSRYASELIKKFNEKVPVRVIVDTEADASYGGNAAVRKMLSDAGIPIRDCVTSAGINHWKMMLFAGQGKVQFSASNYANGSFSPIVPYLEYVDEAIYFTDDAPIVQSFMTKFDGHWIDTSSFRNLANITTPLVRKYPIYPIHPDLNFVPDQHFENRLRTEVGYETDQIDAIIFRITSDKIPNALIERHLAGTKVRLITEEMEYRNEGKFWDAYNVDRMYMAGIPIKVKNNVTEQDVHQKSMVLHGRSRAPGGAAGPMAVFGSSNWTTSSSTGQREHNYFTRKPWMVDWFIDQFNRKWNNTKADGSPIGTAVFVPFKPRPPAAPINAAPANDALGVDGASVTLQWEGGYWAHKYDIYLDTTSAFTAPLVADYMPSFDTSGVHSRKETYTFTGLTPGVTYYWRVVGKTMANMTAQGPVWRFTTAGGLPAPPAPTGFSATAVSATRVDLAWTDVAGEQGYKIERKLASSSTWTQIATPLADVTAYQDSTGGLSPDTSYDYRLRAYTSGGNSPYTAAVRVRTRAAAAGTGDIVLYASTASPVVGQWSVVADATAAGGKRLSNPNVGATRLNTALANPADYFELRFTASAGRPYRLWMRGKATYDNKYNDSVHVQFSGSVNASGTPVYRIGTTSSTVVELEDCSGCALKQWGWVDNGYGSLGPQIYFAASGVQTIRVQVREDGPSFDQIVLSPATYLNAGPGSTQSDTVILPPQDGSSESGTTEPPPDPPVDPPPAPPDVILYASDASARAGAWTVVADGTAAGGARMFQPDAGVAKIRTASASPVHYFELTFNAEAGHPYRLWLRALADADGYDADSVHIQFSGSVDGSGNPIFRIGTTSSTEMNLEDCSGCGLSGWGWQDNGWGVGVLGPVIRFAASGLQTIRIQAREDGVSIDQIVLSASTYLTTAPGALKNDTTILPR